MDIRRATETDFIAMWPIFHAVVASGTSYVFAPDTNRQAAFEYWFGAGSHTYVAQEAGRIIGMYKLMANHRDLGSHVANASFMVSPEHSGHGAGEAMGLHCLSEARRAGFAAMQFNFVVSTNDAAVALWKKLGFAVVGTLPKAFAHQQLGLVDVYIMYRFLDDIET